MVKIPPYLKLITPNEGKRQVREPRPAEAVREAAETSRPSGTAESRNISVIGSSGGGDVVVSLGRKIGGANGDAATSADQAERALRELTRELPAAGSEKIGALHQFADRRRVMDLLMPLVED